ncbi:MAG: hypothetical protein IJQ80_03580, partial [Clostridia bacterium]|nr:hypothetical protein [Clostridia bacterium]
MRKHTGLSLLSFLLVILLCVPTFLSPVVFADGDVEQTVTPDKVFETGDASPKLTRSNMLSFFGDNALSSANYGVAPYGSDTDSITTVNLISSYSIPGPGFYTVYKTTKKTGGKPDWSQGSSLIVEVKVYVTATCSVSGCDDGALLLNGTAVEGSVKLYRGTEYTFTAKEVDGFVYSIVGAEEGVAFLPEEKMTVSAVYISNKFATVSLNVGEGGTAAIICDGAEVGEKVPEGSGFSVKTTPDAANGYYLDSIIITKNREPYEGAAVDEVADGDVYEVTVSFRQATIALPDMDVNIVDVEDKNFTNVE